MSQVPNQRYPDREGWTDLDDILVNGWGVPGSHQSLQAYADGNMVSLFGRVQIGTDRTIGALPGHLRSPREISIPALILGGPSCLVEVQGGWSLVMSAYSLGMTHAQMIAAYGGMYLSIAGSYPRGA